MNFFDVGSLLFEFEEEAFEFYKDKDIDGWNSWVILRRPLYYHIFNNKFKEVEAGQATSETSDSGSVLKKRLQDFTKFQFLYFTKLVTKSKRKLTVMFPFSTGKIYNKQTGLNTDFLMDPFIIYKALNNYLYLETSIEGKLIRPATIKPDALADGLFLPVSTLKAVYRKRNYFGELADKYAQALNDFFKRKNQSFVLNSETLREIFINFYAEYNVYKLFFSTVKPKLAIFNDELFSGKMTAAIKSGIKTIELQHGFIGKYKPDYYLAGQLNKIRPSIPLCDKLAVFGQFHKDVILEPGFWKDEEIEPIGNFLIEQAREKTISRPDNVFTILFPTQWHVFEESKELLTEVIQYVKSKKLRLIIKVHPRENEANTNWYENFAQENNKYVQFASKEVGFYDLLQSSDLLIGFDSTTLLEAISLYVPTITVATPVIPRGIHTYLWTDQLAGAIKIAGSPNQVKDLIGKLYEDPAFNRSWKEETARQSEYLYTSSYKEKIKSIIAELLPE